MIKNEHPYVNFEKLDEDTLQEVCNILGDECLTGSEIGKIFEKLDIPDPEPDKTKRYRLSEGLNEKQDSDGTGTCVFQFIERALNPVKYTDCPQKYDLKRGKINKILSFKGYELTEEGKITKSEQASTLKDAVKRANALEDELKGRGVHQDVLNFCQAELLKEDYFYMVFEANKSVADKIRRMTGLTEDGRKLFDKALSTKNPMLKINPLETESDMSEQKGFSNFLTGVWGMFRNVTAHESKINMKMEKQDALDALTMISYAHRRLDEAEVVKRI